MNNSLFSYFMPKEPKFFPLLNSLADIVVDCGDLLVNCLSSSSYKEALEITKQIKEKEREADRISQHIFDELNTTFITPFDREDVHNLTDALENVTDGINSCAKVFLLYHVNNSHTEIITLAELVKEASLRIKEMITPLEKLQKNLSSIGGAVNELYRIESEADNVC
jgi:predicted phosphate transport protein (TIGR00153 family)